VLLAVMLLRAAPAIAHVGSPNVFLESDAGPYHLFVTVRVPQVIPGVAEIEVRANSDDVREIHTTVTRLTGAGSKYAPVPDLAKRSAQDPRFFTSSLWLMEFGSLEVKVLADGARGHGEMAVPVPSFAQRTFKMPPELGAFLLVLVLGLTLGLIAIVGAAVREAVVEPGAAPAPEYRRRGMRAMAITAAIMAAVFYLGYGWWSADARSYQATVDFFKPAKLDLTLEHGNHLILKPADSAFRRNINMVDLIPDHGHLMHLYMIRMPAMDQVRHLHPDRMPDGSFVKDLPSMPGSTPSLLISFTRAGFRSRWWERSICRISRASRWPAMTAAVR
jgi:hypothetical protein